MELHFRIDVKQNRRSPDLTDGRTLAGYTVIRYRFLTGQEVRVLFSAFAANEGNPISMETSATHDCIWDARSCWREADIDGTRDYRAYFHPLLFLSLFFFIANSTVKWKLASKPLLSFIARLELDSNSALLLLLRLLSSDITRALSLFYHPLPFSLAPDCRECRPFYRLSTSLQLVF